MLRKRKLLLSLFLVAVILISACSTAPAEVNYENSIQWLEKSKPDKDGNYSVSDWLLCALENTQFTEAKNIIYMIGDGMGPNIIQATQEKHRDTLYGNKLAINHLPLVGTHSTYSASDKITDSAAGGTALASGYKTSNYSVGLNSDHSAPYKSVLELAAEKGKSTGIIATKSVTDATPAAFTTHVEDRKMQNEIAGQQLEKLMDGTLDLVLGGGSEYYEYFANESALEAAQENGVAYNTKWEDAKKAKLPMVGLFASSALLNSSPMTPTLAEMTELALGLMSEDENGFFLLIEGSQIDTEAHDNSLEKEIREMYSFDAAVAVAMKYVALHPDTVLIITADHETGGLYFPKEGYGKGDNYAYLSEEHTFINVPVYAIGYGTEALGGIMENTDIAAFVASLLGEENFGEKSQVTTLYESGTSDGMKFVFGETNIDGEQSGQDLLTGEMLAQLREMTNVRALHCTLRNTGTEKVTLPAIRIATTEGTTYDVIPQYAYIEGGQTLDLTYVLPVELWQDGAFLNVDSVKMTYQVVADQSWKTTFGYEKENVTLEMQKISATERGLTK